MIPLQYDLKTSVLDVLRLDASDMNVKMEVFYEQALLKFSPLLAYFDDRGKAVITLAW